MNVYKFKNKIRSFNNKKYFICPQNSKYIVNTKTFIKKTRNVDQNFSQILYVIMRLEEKIDLITKNETKTSSLKVLLNIYNFLINQLYEKQKKISYNNLVLSSANDIYQFKKEL
jgi:hypothetical protein